MEINLIWEDEALDDLKQIFDYLKEKNLRAAYGLSMRLYNAAESLKQFPKMGPVESLLEDCDEIYRYVVVDKYYKLIYVIENNTIHIIMIWDCRRAPEKVKDSIK